VVFVIGLGAFAEFLPGFSGLSYPLQVAVFEGVVLGLPLLCCAGAFGWDLRTVLSLRLPARRSDWVVFPALALLAAPALDAVSEGICALFPSQAELSRALSDELAARGAGELWLLLLALGTVTGIAEEAVFRGAVLSGLRTRAGGAAAVAASALLFGIVHQAPFLILPATLAGLLLGWSVLRTGSLGPAVAGHALVNAASVAAASAFGDASLFELPRGVPILVASLLLLLLGILLVERRVRRDEAAAALAAPVSAAGPTELLA